MKYKLISKTLEETICSKVVVNGFDYYVSDDEIFKNDYFYNPATKEILFASKDMLSWNSDTTQEHKGWKKIITSNNPNIDLPQVIDE